MTRAWWIGGPADGSYLQISERLLYRPIRVATGHWTHPTYREVTPRLDEAGQWILPFYEGQIVNKETR